MRQGLAVDLVRVTPSALAVTPPLQVHGTIGHFVEFGELMAGDQYGLTLGGHSPHQPVKVDASLRIETGRRFVEW